MAKALLATDDVTCEDLTDDEDPLCVMEVILREIINGQNFQIQAMRGILDSLNLPATDDCEIELRLPGLGIPEESDDELEEESPAVERNGPVRKRN